MEVLTIDEAKTYTGGFKITLGAAVIASALISFALGFVNAFFSPTCSK